MTSAPPFPFDKSIRAAAAAWTVRRDRGLSAAESIEFELWLAADKRHADAIKRTAGAWALLDRIPESAAVPVIAAVTRRRLFWRISIVASSLAAAAAIALMVVRVGRAPAEVTAPAAVASAAAVGPRQIMLSDGSVVELNTASEVIEQFTAGERRVLLVRGEAHFSVTKNPTRPFFVRAGHVEVRAVGTAFNVHLESAAVEVLVTEGVVKLSTSADGAASAARSTDSIPSLTPGQRALVALEPTSPEVAVVVTTVSQAEISRTLAWQEPLLRLSGATLAEVAADFEHRTGRRVVLANRSLGALRLGGRFRADDVDGFVSVLATTLDISVERTADGALVLRKKDQIRDSGK